MAAPAHPPMDYSEGKLKIYFLPNLLTAGNLFCGFVALTKIVEADLVPSPEGVINWAPIQYALGFILLACIFDLFDGRVARMGGVESPFGREFDSLADVISFGVAPAVLSFSWGLSPLGRLGWAAGFIFVAAAAVRLARFNIQAGSQDKRYFVGMPSPAAAAVPAATVFAYPIGFATRAEALPVLAIVIVPALLMTPP